MPEGHTMMQMMEDSAKVAAAEAECRAVKSDNESAKPTPPLSFFEAVKQVFFPKKP